jgi:hypothetical protein
MELTKSDKKAARAIIEKGLMKEFSTGLTEFSSILKEWEYNNAGSRETYHTLFKSLKDFDKHIARRYDYLTGSHYAGVIIAQYCDGLIDDKDMESFSEAARKEIYARINALKQML